MPCGGGLGPGFTLPASSLTRSISSADQRHNVPRFMATATDGRMRPAESHRANVTRVIPACFAASSVEQVFIRIHSVSQFACRVQPVVVCLPSSYDGEITFVTSPPNYTEWLIRVLAFVGGVASTVVGSWVSSKIRVFHDNRKAHLEDLKQRVLIPLSEASGENFTQLFSHTSPLIEE